MTQHTMALPAVLTASEVVSVQAQLRKQLQAIPAQSTVVLDAASVQTFDSACLALLLACRREAQARAQTLQVVHWPDKLQSLAQVYGVLPLLDPAAA